MRCRLILLISEHPIQQGIRKGGGPHFCHRQTRRGEDEEWRILGSRIYSKSLQRISILTDLVENAETVECRCLIR